MRNDQAFMGELRTEINQSQQRRHEHVAAKLVFISGLLGLGSLSLENMPTRQLLFIVPIVAFAYDLYILGEDYGIRRAGSFIRCSGATPPQEVLWEKLVQTRKDPFSSAAGPLSSAITIGVAAIGLAPLANAGVYIGWLALSVSLFLGLWHYRQKSIRELQKWEDEITKRQEELKGKTEARPSAPQQAPEAILAAPLDPLPPAAIPVQL